MRSERPPSAGTGRRTTFSDHEVVKTFFGGWAMPEGGIKAGPGRLLARRPSPQYPLASGEGAS